MPTLLPVALTLLIALNQVCATGIAYAVGESLDHRERDKWVYAFMVLLLLTLMSNVIAFGYWFTTL